MPDLIDQSDQRINPVINMGAFLMMCLKMKIDSKEFGHCSLNPISTQKYLIEEIIEGLKRGIHTFVILKCRQSGTTTIVLAFLLYWLMRHGGMTGLFAIDDSDKKIKQNLAFRKMYDTLAEAGDDWCQPRTHDSREIVAFANGSDLMFENANKRKKGTLGVSLGTSILFADELGMWDDQDSVVSLSPSLAEMNPNRLFIYGGTARGFNLFHKLYTTAEEASDQKAIFIPWWRQDWYRIERSKSLFLQYWDGQLNGEEESWVSQVRSRYDVEITPEQVAWWRHKLDTKFLDNLPALYQEYPPLPELAFQYGGATFFDPEALRQATARITVESQQPLTLPDSPYIQCQYKSVHFRFRPGKNFLDSAWEQCANREGLYHLAVWDPPRHGDGVMYSIGVDPVYGMNEKSDYACIQLLRCFEDGMEQVAEFAVRGMSSMHTGWALLYLFGAYHLTEGVSNVVWNTEIQGGGSAIINTIEQIQQDIGGFYDRLGVNFDQLRAYAYKRVDSLTPNYSAKHSHMNAVVRDQVLHHIKNYFESGRLILHSPHLIQEMSVMMVSPDRYIESSGSHDDLVFGLAAAIMNYWDPIRYDMEGSGFTLEKWQKERELLMRGARNEDLITMRMRGWLEAKRAEKRDEFEAKEDDLMELLENERGYY